MLSLIRIKNYAIIDEVEVDFAPGLNVMTGETGAGKSILVDALGLALGDRADSTAVRRGTDKAEISVIFDCPPGHPVIEWLAARELDDDDSCTLRRVISAEGRSRAFVNGSPVSLTDLRQLGSLLIEIHGQHEHQSLLQPGAQRRLLDHVAGATGLATELREAHARWHAAAEALAGYAARSEEQLARIEFLGFQLKELEELGLAEGEIEDLRSEYDRLANIDALAGAVQAALELVYAGDAGSGHALVSQSVRTLEAVDAFDPGLRQVAEQLRSVEIELRDAASTLSRYCDDLEPDPQRLNWLETRLTRVHSLARRHQVDEELLWQKTAAIAAELDTLAAGELSQPRLAEREAATRAEYDALAGKLSAARAAAATQLAAEVTAEFRALGLGNGEFEAGLVPRAEPDANGRERIEFRVCMNPGEGFGALDKVASGGELSRVSLALEVIAGGGSSVPTFVFDEVDAGIGGGVAEIVGLRLRALSATHQVLCVTHLAQVASQGEAHFRVAKLTDGTTSRTSVARLDANQRVDELSRMIGGIEITATTRAHAAEMIARASN